MTKPTCYLLGHRKGVGKNYLADLTNLKQFSFAEELKKLVEDLFDLPPGVCDDSDAKANLRLPNGYTLRDALVDFGQTARKHDRDIWVRKVSHAIMEEALDEDVVVTDYRFPNEANLSIPHRIVRVLVTREGWDPPSDEADDALMDIPALWDWHIHNTTEKELRDQWYEMKLELGC